MSASTAQTKLRRLGMLAVGIVAATLITSGCSATPTETAAPEAKPTFAADSTMARIQEAGVLKVGTKYDQPGWGLRDLSGNIVGLDPDVAVLVANALGLSADDIEYTEAVSANREPFIEQGTVDMVVASYAISEERQQVVTFAGPYIELGQTLMVAKGNPLKIKSIDDLAGKTVCSITGGDTQRLVPELVPTANIVSFDVSSKCETALKSGQVDAFGSNAVIIGGLVAADPDTELVNFEYGGQTFGVGMKKGDLDFCTFVNDVLTKAAADGTWKKDFADTIGALLPAKSDKFPEFIPCS
jgi:glutamate transport system substrate-binding protein